MFKKIFGSLFILTSFTFGIALFIYFPFERFYFPPTMSDMQSFNEIPVEFEHVISGEGIVYPFMGAAVIDLEGDGIMEVFVGGGDGQPDGLLQLENNELVNRMGRLGLSSDIATYGATSVDMDHDGDSDLLVARDDGLTLYLNKINEGGNFVGEKIPLPIEANEVPFSVAVSDIEQDGDLDLYVSMFIEATSFRPRTFNDVTHAKQNLLLLNNGDLTFTDITEEAGVGGSQNTWNAVFVDLDGDRLQDLVVAQNTGAIELYRNSGKGSFQVIPTNSGLGFWTGIAVGDIDNDGDQDLFFSNVGNSLPPYPFSPPTDLLENQRLATEWLLLRNEGNFNFKNVTEEYNLTGNGFAWGAIFEDLNLDGDLDLLVAQNDITIPAHEWLPLTGKAMLQQSTQLQKGFYHSSDLGLDNPYFAQAPLIADLDGDGRQDMLWINRNGPTRAFLNQSSHNFITLNFPDNIDYLGTTATIKTKHDSSYTKVLMTSIGNMSDQTAELTFGLGDITEIEKIEIVLPNGEEKVIEQPTLNEKIMMK